MRQRLHSGRHGRECSRRQATLAESHKSLKAIVRTVIGTYSSFPIFLTAAMSRALSTLTKSANSGILIGRWTSSGIKNADDIWTLDGFTHRLAQPCGDRLRHALRREDPRPDVELDIGIAEFFESW